MIEEIINETLPYIKSFLPYKQIRILRRNNKRIKKIYYGNLSPLNLEILYTLRRLVK